jgi:membrane protease YdiL (CAAX protease family)
MSDGAEFHYLLPMMSRKAWQGEIVLMFWGALFICTFLGQLIVALLHKAGVHGFSQEYGFGTILLATLSFQGAALCLIPFFLWLYRVPLREAFGFRKDKILILAALVAVVLVITLVVTLPLQALSAWAMEKIHWQPQEQTAVEIFLRTNWWPTGIYLAVFAVVLAPVAEELVFRGMLFPCFKQMGLHKTAWFGVSLFFAAIHFDAATFVPLFVLALILTWLYEFTDNLLVPIAVHALFNATNLVLLCLTK